MAGQTEDKVIESHRRIIRAIDELKPVMIYFTFDDIEALLLRTFQVRNAEWGRGERAWEQFVTGIVEQQQWAKIRGLKGREMWFKFFSEWVLVAEKLYHQFPFPKIQIQNPRGIS